MTKGIKNKVRGYFLEPVSSNYQQINSLFNRLYWGNYVNQCKEGNLQGMKLLDECIKDYNFAKIESNKISKLIDSMLREAKSFKKLCLLSRDEINI